MSLSNVHHLWMLPDFLSVFAEQFHLDKKKKCFCFLKVFFFLFRVSCLMLLLNDSWELWTQNGIINQPTDVNVLVWEGFQGEKGRNSSFTIKLRTLQETTHLSRLTVDIDLWQAGGLFRRSEGLKLTEVGKIGLLGNLLGGGGCEYCSASWSPLCLCTMPSEWYWGLEREVMMQLDLTFCCMSVSGTLLLLLRVYFVCLTCVGRGRGGTAGG